MVAYNETLYVFGGWDGGTLGELYSFDTWSAEWRKLKTAGEGPRLCGHTMTLAGSQVFVFGGFDGAN